MANKQPKKRSTPKRKSRSIARKRSNSQPGIILILLLVIVAAIVLSYFITGGNYKQYFKQLKERITLVSATEDEQTTGNSTAVEVVDSTESTSKKLPSQKEKSAEKTILEGTWVSTLNGAMLTFNGNTFQVEFPSIEERAKLKGHFKVSNNSLHLVNTLSDDLCGMKEGVYSFEMKDGDLILTAKSDPCNMRKTNLATDWFKL